MDPVKRVESIFNVRRADGSLVPLKVPKSQYDILRRGILGSGKRLTKQGLTYRRVVDKGRQQGFSIILAVEAILIAEDFPDTFQYYVATRADQAASWLDKVEQLCNDANHYPEEVGGGPILHLNNLKPVMKKTIHNCVITGFAANPSGMRGDCLLPEQIIYLEDGTEKLVKDLKVGDNLVGLDIDTNKQQSNKITGIKKQPLMDIWKLETTCGKELQASENHPILTPNGWIPISNLKKNNYVGIPNKFNYFGNKEIDINTLKIIAYLIGDGTYGKYKNGFGFTNNDEIIINDVVKCCHNLKINYSIRWEDYSGKYIPVGEMNIKPGKKGNCKCVLHMNV